MVKISHKESYYLEENIGSRRDRVPFLKLRQQFSKEWFPPNTKKEYLNPVDEYRIKDSFYIVEHHSDEYKESFTWKSKKWIPIHFFRGQWRESREHWLTFNEFALDKFRYTIPRNPKSVLSWKSHIGKCLLLEFFNRSVGTRICRHFDLLDKLDPKRREYITKTIKKYKKCGVKFRFSPYTERTRVNLSKGIVKPSYKQIFGDEG